MSVFRSFGVHPLPPFIFSLPHLVQYSSPHVLTIQSRLSHICSLMFATPALALISSIVVLSILCITIIHLNILISVLSTKFCSAFPSAQVSLPSIQQNRSDVGLIIYCCFKYNVQSQNRTGLHNNNNNYCSLLARWLFDMCCVVLDPEVKTTASEAMVLIDENRIKPSLPGT